MAYLQLSFLAGLLFAGLFGGVLTGYSWGGFPIKGPDGRWNLIHAQMKNHCESCFRSDLDTCECSVRTCYIRFYPLRSVHAGPLGSWTSNSIVARSVSTTSEPEGPYVFAEELLPPFAHNPTIRQAEDGVRPLASNGPHFVCQAVWQGGGALHLNSAAHCCYRPMSSSSSVVGPPTFPPASCTRMLRRPQLSVASTTSRRALLRGLATHRPSRG